MSTRKGSGHAAEILGYVSTSVGMALACSGYAMLSDLRQLLRGPWLLVSIVVAGLLCVGISLSIAELASLYPSAPGIRTYLRRAFGDLTSLAMTYLVFGVVALFAGVESYIFVDTIRPLSTGLSDAAIMSGIVVLLIVVNLVNVDVPLRVQILLTLALVAVLGTASALALGVKHTGAAPAPHPVEITSLLSAVGGAVFLYTGFEWVTPLGRSSAAYRSRIPWSMPIALVVLILLFVGLGAAVDHVAPDPNMQAPHLAVGAAVWGKPGRYSMMLVSLLSMITTFNAGLMGASRLVYALARERRFPRWGARLLKNGVPIGGVLFTAGLVWCAQMLELRFHLHRSVALVCAALYCGIYAAFVYANVRMRKLSATAAPFRSPVPLGVQTGFAIGLGVFGIAILLSDSELRLVSCWLLAAVAVGSLLIARFFGRTKAAPLPTSAPSAVLATNPKDTEL